MAVVASVFIVAGVLLFLQQGPVGTDLPDTTSSSSQIDSSVDQWVEQMGKLNTQWKTLLAEQKIAVQETENELAAIKRKVGQLVGVNIQKVNQKTVKQIRQEMVAVDKRFQQNHSNYQSGVGNLQAATNGLLTQKDGLAKEPLEAEAKRRFEQAGESLGNSQMQARKYQEESEKVWNTQVAALEQRLDGLEQRLVKLGQDRQQALQTQADRKAQEQQDLQQRVDLLITRIDDVLGKVRSMGKAQYISLQRSQKAIQGSEQNVEGLSVPTQQQLDEVRQRLANVNTEFQRNQERYRDELKAYRQQIQDISQEVKTIQTLGLKASTLKKIVNSAQTLKDVVREIEASQNDTNLVWSQQMAKIQSRLLEFKQALASGNKGNAQDDAKDEERKIQELETIVGEIRQMFQDQDLAALHLATDLSSKHAEVLKALFANWTSFTVQTTIDSIGKDSAKVIVQLHEMVDKRGKRARPHQEAIIGRHVLHIPKQGGEWGKPQW